MSNPRTPRRSAEQWQALIEQWQQSGQSAKAFCREHDLGYASFCQWRKRLASANEPTRSSGQGAQEPAFVDLASLASSGAGGWDIVLSLGDGVELRLSRR